MNNWLLQEKPSDKLLQKGASTLTDIELLAIILRTGIKGSNALVLAENLLTNFGGFSGIFHANQAEFCQLHWDRISEIRSISSIVRDI